MVMTTGIGGFLEGLCDRRQLEAADREVAIDEVGYSQGQRNIFER